MAFIQHSGLEDGLDVELMFTGDRFPVVVGPNLLSSGWRGGTWVVYTTGDQDFTVEISDGNLASGFLLFQSENYQLTPPNGTGPGSPENWISHQYRQGTGGQNVTTLCVGGQRAFFKVYETEALAGGVRSGTLTYTLGEKVRVSENGLLCQDSDAELANVGIAAPVDVGIVSAIPSEANGNRLCVDINL